MDEIRELEQAFQSYRKAKMFEREYQCAEAVYGLDRKRGHILLNDFREDTAYDMQTGGDVVKDFDLQRRSYVFEGKDNFDAFMVAMEWERNPKSRFWLPRRRILEGNFGVCSEIQSFMEQDGERKLTLSTPPGCGKALANDTKVLTRNGWKNHGDLIVGDEVIGLDGKFKKVLRVFPKVMLDCKVTFSNNQTIICHENHEWLVDDRNSHCQKICETKYLENRSIENGSEHKRGHRYTFGVPKVNVIGKNNNLLIDAYTLGVWLGDGTNRNPTICGDVNDSCIVDRIVKNGNILKWKTQHKTTNVMYYGFDFRSKLQAYGMCHSRRKSEKHIPFEYLISDKETRLNLLAGLIDTDGYLNGHKYQFTTSETRLRDDVITLISSLGWKCYYVTIKPSTSTSGITARSEYYVISFVPNEYIPCELPRKQLNQFGVQRKIYIEKIERVTPKEGNCIEVEDSMYLVGQTLIPTHNSTLIKFLLAYIAGKFPQSMNMYISYADGMVKLMIDAVTDMMIGDEYNFQEIFPLGNPSKSAEYNTLGYRRKGDAQTINFCSVGGSITGRTRANKFIITDDLVKNAEVARSPERLETLYQDYSDTIMTRTIGDSWKEIQLGTIWSIYDPISREKIKHDGEVGYHFIALPVCDDEGHSNFDYDCEDRYTDDRIADLKEKLDPVTFSCLYMQRGIQKEGMPFTHDRLQWYNGELPDGEPDNVLFYCDVAWGGGDSLSMPIAYCYGDSVFIHDVVFNRGDKSVTKPKVVAAILKHKIKMGRFEANLGGTEYADDISAKLKEQNYSCNITSKRAPNTMSKNTRIEQHQDTIRTFYFRNDRERGKEYDQFINELEVFSFTAKNLHDDAADSIAGLVGYKFDGSGKITLGKRMF